jgi:hypothetical protein
MIDLQVRTFATTHVFEIAKRAETTWQAGKKQHCPAYLDVTQVADPECPNSVQFRPGHTGIT